MTVVLILALVVAIAAGLVARTFITRYSLERGEHRRVIELFSRYVPAPVVAELLARRDPRLFQAREYYATIVVCRIHNFALLSESLSPEETLRYLNEFYTVLGKAVQRHHGMIESLRGDSVVAVFGVLLEEQFQEERALRASLDMLRMMRAMQERWQAEGRKGFTVGIGVNSGKIVAGDTGFQQRREFAIIGNPVEVAARLEAASEDLNATIVASATTYDVVRELFVGVPTSSLPLRGLRRLHSAYVIRGLSRRATTGDDNLRLPPQRSFNKTVVEPEERVERVAPELYREPARIDASATPPTIVDKRVATPVVVDRPSFEFKPPAPEVRRFSRLDDDEAALPDLPFIETYEDDQGPPIQLPP
jgi:class 3 adenylate cyclase